MRLVRWLYRATVGGLSPPSETPPLVLVQPPLPSPSPLLSRTLCCNCCAAASYRMEVTAVATANAKWYLLLLASCQRVTLVVGQIHTQNGFSLCLLTRRFCRVSDAYSKLRYMYTSNLREKLFPGGCCAYTRT